MTLLLHSLKTRLISYQSALVKTVSPFGRKRYIFQGIENSLRNTKTEITFSEPATSIHIFESHLHSNAADEKFCDIFAKFRR